MKHCTRCDVEWFGDSPCWVCNEPGAALPEPIEGLPEVKNTGATQYASTAPPEPFPIR